MNLLIPKEFNEEDFIKFMKKMVDELLENEKDISFCGSAKSWLECFNGFKKPDGTFHLCLHYNVGSYTKGIIATYYPN